MTYTDILLSFKCTLGLIDPNEHIFVCDINCELIRDPQIAPTSHFLFKNVKDMERLLVGTYVGEYVNQRIDPKPELEVVLYLEDGTGELEEPLRVNFLIS